MRKIAFEKRIPSSVSLRYPPDTNSQPFMPSSVTASGYHRHGAFDIVDAIGGRDLPDTLRSIGEVALKDDELLRLLGMLGFLPRR